MTPQEKAIQLVESFKFETKHSEIINDIILGDISVVFQHHKAKQCALIAVEEILEATKKYVAVVESVPYSKTGVDFVVNTEYDKYWIEVQKELQKLCK
jgi:hypothetical protein